jgi:YkoP domain
LRRRFDKGGHRSAPLFQQDSTSFQPQNASSLDTSAGAWVEQAVFALDRWLRQRQGVYEYSDDPLCMFRAQRTRADCDLRLSDGTRVRSGDPVVNLHLWNEHVPAMGESSVSMMWAREFTRRVEISMHALARHLRWNRSLDDVVAIRGDMRLGAAEQSDQLARLAGRYGFEAAGSDGLDLGLATLRRTAENVFLCLLVLATNPVALRAPVLRRHHKLVYLSRAVLETRYAPTARFRDGRVGG